MVPYHFVSVGHDNFFNYKKKGIQCQKFVIFFMSESAPVIFFSRRGLEVIVVEYFNQIGTLRGSCVCVLCMLYTILP